MQKMNQQIDMTETHIKAAIAIMGGVFSTISWSNMDEIIRLGAGLISIVVGILAAVNYWVSIKDKLEKRKDSKNRKKEE